MKAKEYLRLHPAHHLRQPAFLKLGNHQASWNVSKHSSTVLRYQCRCTIKMQTIILLNGAARDQTNRDGVNREDGEDHNFISLPSGTRNT